MQSNHVQRDGAVPDRVIALFVKPPIPGRVKTRLARDIGDEAACRIYTALADQTILHIQATGIPLVLFYDGDDQTLVPDIWKQPARCCIPQKGKDLGERMADAFCHIFTIGFSRVVLVGSDIPGIDAPYLHQAFDLLDSHQLVIGPAVDGGYCLIGCAHQHFSRSVFQHIPWSTDQVSAMTLQAAERAGLSVGLLPILRDIDTLEDLRAYQATTAYLAEP